MALSEFEQKRVERAIGEFIEKHRPAAHIRPQLDLGFRLAGQSVEIFEIRPQWDKPEIKREHPVAKATYVKTQETWHVFWMRRDLRWHRYEPAAAVGSIEAFLKLVDEDKHACFWG